MQIFILQGACHDDFESNWLHGIYSSKELAEEANIRIFGIPQEFKATGEIHEVTLDEDIKIEQKE